MTAAPVDAAVPRPPIDLEVLAVVLTGELRRLRHGVGSAVCWGCPRDAAVLVARVDRAFAAGLL